mmetsp:Transcript_37806/g.65328  ORF Transcript_37806/g.65328 Transcript_37806/m.65328 type:complete len:182 (-) Transcript_37806:165-710(-)|eukprot:CAMPEP_0185002152 /NCGR_PEP_ID=MMETSP1098-20130426/73119_1 /TAXON_ID=89044 /ORGANISM="Spumella elongata, Strain CCAP 955/1" /LENGTH=181 /DNA_ID=CAMNT_0027529595 /DNA_START=39 /DNA_END=584 /DNA_ORIENTATION=+
MQGSDDSALYQTTDWTCPHPQCGLLFKDQRALKKHFRHHKPNTMIVKCKVCPDVFLDSLALRAHFTACHKDALFDLQSQSLKRRKVAKPVLEEPSAAEEKTKHLLRQQINSVAVLYDQQLNDLECHEAELLQELANCSAALDQALRFIAQAGGGAIDIPFDLQVTAHKYAGVTNSFQASSV